MDAASWSPTAAWDPSPWDSHIVKLALLWANPLAGWPHTPLGGPSVGALHLCQESPLLLLSPGMPSWVKIRHCCPHSSG